MWRALLALVTVLSVSGGLVGAAAPGQASVQDAAAALEGARAEYADATTALQDALALRLSVGEQASAFEVQLRELDAASLEKVISFEAKLREARELAVDAYVRGGTQAEFENYLDAEEATDIVLRRHLMIGRVDQAEEAASILQSERMLVDRQAAAVATQVAELNALYDDADAAVARAERREQAAYAALVEADAATAAAVRAAEEAEAARIAAEERAAEDARIAAEAEEDAEQEGDEPSAANEPAVLEPFVPPSTDTGDQAEAWAKLVECESGGNYRAIGGGGLYRGAYQFSQPTWESVGGVGDPIDASPAEQDYRARVLYERSGRGQWPLCGRWLR